MNIIEMRPKIKVDPIAEVAALATTMGLRAIIRAGEDFEFLSIGPEGAEQWSLMQEDGRSWLLCWAGSADPLAGGSQSFLQNYATAREALLTCCKMVREVG